jgi:hypothetical protein
MAGGTSARLSRDTLLVIILLVLSALLLTVAPLAMPAGYSWRIHSISESAAQGLPFAWIARLGFVLYGLAVLKLSWGMKNCWSLVTRWLGFVFAFSLFGAALFSHRPWLPEVPADPREDLLHSIAASGMGTAFCIGVAWRLFTRERVDRIGRVFDTVALLVAICVSIFLGISTGCDGLAQRLMFIFGYLWFAREAGNLGGEPIDAQWPINVKGKR